MPNVDIRLQATGNAQQELTQTERQLQRMSSNNITNAATHRRATGIMTEGNRQLAISNDEAGWSFDQLSGQVTTIISGLAALAVVQKGIELVNLGEQVHDTTIQFEAYVGAIGNTTEILQQLRAATLGGASDIDLMTSSAQLASLGLATTQEDLSKFIGLSYRLTGSTEQVNNLALALTNMSYLRLDAFGLSADTARKRVAELKDEFEGIGDTEAFTRAVIEQMENKVEDFGETLDAQTTNIDRFKVGWANFWNDLALIASDGANNVLGELDRALNPNAGDVALIAEADTYLSAVAQRLIESGQRSAQEIGENNDFFVELVRSSIKTAIENPDLQADVDGMLGAIAADMQMPLMLIQDYADVVNESMGIYLGNLREAEALAQITQSFAGEGARLLSSGSAQSAMASQRMTQLAQMRELQREADRLMAGGSAQAEFASNLMQHNRLLDDANMSLQLMGVEYRNITDDAGMLGDVHIVTPDDAARIVTMREQYDYIVERAERLAEEGIISQSELDYIKAGADEAARMADEMQRGSDALEDMSRSDFFGTEGGGLFGELSDEVIQAARDRGLTDAQIQELQDAFDLQSGRENEASLRWRDEIIPLIVDTASGASKTATDDAIAALQQYILDQGTAQFGAEAGAYLAGDDLIPSADVYEPFRTATMEIGDNFKVAGDGTTVMQEQLTVADLIAANLADSSGRVESHFNNVTSRVQRINVEINVQSVTGGALETWLASNVSRVVRDEGGTVPGTDARTQRTGGR